MSLRKAVLIPAFSSSSGTHQRFVFGLGITQYIAVGTEPCPYLTDESAAGTRLQRWRIRANQAPTGADIVIDILKNGSTIFLAGNANKIVLPAGQIRAKGTTFLTSPYSTAYEDELIPNIIQVGSINPGFRIEIQITGLIL